MRVCIFTCARDWDKAAIAIRTIPADWSICYVVESRDKNLKPPEGVEVVVRDFPRGVNLYGTKAVVGVVEALAEQSDIHGRVVKMDSDCLLVDPSFLYSGDVAGMVHLINPLAVVGLAYSLSPRAVKRAREGILKTVSKGGMPQAEDAALTCVANGWEDTRMPTGSFVDSKHDGSLPQAGVKAIHCGCIRYAARTSGAVAREMVRLGDSVGLWRR